MFTSSQHFYYYANYKAHTLNYCTNIIGSLFPRVILNVYQSLCNLSNCTNNVDFVKEKQKDFNYQLK